MILLHNYFVRENMLLVGVQLNLFSKLIFKFNSLIIYYDFFVDNFNYLNNIP
jgi:hypothetical protein